MTTSQLGFGTTPTRLTDELAPGTVVPASDTATARLNTVGLGRLRIRAKTSHPATLSLRFLLSDRLTPAATGNPADIALSADAEGMLDVVLCGEEYAEVSITAGASNATTISYVEVFRSQDAE